MTDYDRWRTDAAQVAEYLEALAAEMRAGRGPTSIRIDTTEERKPMYSDRRMVATMRRTGVIAHDEVLARATAKAERLTAENQRLLAEVRELRAIVVSG